MKALCVDDVEQNLYLLEFQLRGFGYDVATAHDGKEALLRLEAEPFDVIVSDILMPHMDGFELCREVKRRENLRGIPFIFYTATYTDKKDEELGLSLGAVRFILKPEDPERLAALILQAIETQMKGLGPAPPPQPEEAVYLKMYNQRLIEKLERKVNQLAATTEDLRQREGQFWTLIEHSPLAMVISNHAWETLFVNRKFTEVYGYTRDEIPTLEEWWPLAYPDPAYREAIKTGWLARVVESTTTGTGVRPMDATVTCKNGDRREVEFRTSPMGSRTLIVFLDHTERKRAEEQARETASRMAIIAEHSSEAIFSVLVRPDGEFALDFLNPVAARHAGAPLSRSLGLTPSDTLAPDLAAHVTANFQRCLEAGHDIRYEEVLNFQGAMRHMHTSLVPVRGESGRIERIVGFAHDITAVKEAQIARMELEAQLAHAQRIESIGQLAGGVAHDFNNLLTVINGYCDIGLERVRRDDPLYEDLQEIRKAGARAADLTRQLLTFSRRQAYLPAVLDLNQVVSDSEKLLRRLIGENIDFQCRLDAQLYPVHADAGQLHQVIVNLAVNARDAMPGGGSLTVETANVILDDSDIAPHPGAKAGLHVMLAIRDSGKGMDAKTLAHIFEPFFTTKEPGKGTGLGLSTVYGIVKQSGGFINVASEPGRGTTFRVYLPALEESLAAESPAAPPSMSGRGGTVLLVEDQDEVRRLLKTMLIGGGYTVLEASNGQTALRLCREHAGGIDVLVSDVVMPEMDGPALAERALKLRPRMKVLFTSGYTARAGDAGFLEGAGFLRKPFGPAELCSKVRALLESGGAKARILVVDDEEAIRKMFRRALEGAGYEVGEAGDGREAMREVRRVAADLVITDLVMPDQEGIETIQELRREFPGVKIIAVSGALRDQALKMASILGADAALPKPVPPETLLDTVRRVLER